MPVLKALQDIQKFILPSTHNLPENEQAWVMLDISPMVTADVANVEDTQTEIRAGVNMLANRIKEWNYTEEDGMPLKITNETVKLLDLGDFYFLQGQIKEGRNLTDTEKKASSSTSLPEETASTPDSQPQQIT